MAVLRHLAATHAGAFTLAYLDPPFFTNRAHEAKLRKEGAPRTERTRAFAFDDRWPDMAAYLDALGPRIDAIRPLLASHGSVVVHVDPKTSHYVRVLGDEIFGGAAYASEIVWRYRRPCRRFRPQRPSSATAIRKLRQRRAPGAKYRSLARDRAPAAPSGLPRRQGTARSG